MPLSQRPDNKASGKRKKMALGRGLDALIPGIGSMESPDQAPASKLFFECDIDVIEPNRYQPRTHFAPEELSQLSDSIRTQGILQPLLVRKLAFGYELVAGERRLRAAKAAGLKQVPVVVKEISDSEMLEISIVENIQRENLNPIEEAEAYHRLMVEFGLTQDQAATRVGKSRSAVANMLRLRQLPEQIKSSIFDGQLSMGHARALLGADSPPQQHAAWRVIIGKGLSVRQAEALVKQLKNATPMVEPKKMTSEDRHLSSVADNLSRQFGTKVQIKRTGKKGRLEIEFYSNDDLDRLLGLLNEVG
jgi:ParB family transcriptional regulator, chromosome partitioning protein